MMRRAVGLRARALILVGLALLGSLALDAYFANRRREQALVEATVRVGRMASSMVEQENASVTFVRDFARLLVDVADVPQLAQAGRCPGSFARIVKEEPRIANIVLIDLEGNVRCLATGSPENVNVADRPYFRHALLSDEFVMDEPIVGRATGKWSIPFAQAIRDAQGKAHAVFLVMLDLKWLDQELTHASLPSGARVGLIDARGTVLARHPDPDGWIGRDASKTPFFAAVLAHAGRGTAEARGFDGVQRLYGLAKFADTTAGPIYLWAGVDKESVTAQVNREFASSLALAIGLYAFAFAAIWWGGARLLRPLGVMSAAAQRLAQGDYSARAGVRYSRDEVGTLARSFDRMAEALETRTRLLEAANAELEAFAYSVSHDLRTPLRAIDGFSEAVLEDYRGKLDAQGEQYLQRLRNAAQRMGQLIDDLLRLSRVTRLEMKPERVDLSALAEEIVAELRKATPKRAVSVEIEPGLVSHGDPALLRVALHNLLGNAWKFTSGTPQARIAFGAQTAGGEPRYFVRDNGAGFDMTYAKNLFTAFQRLHNPAEFPGTGIGLATVKRVIVRHGGQVSAEGAPGKGATFYFTLPVTAREAVPDGDQQADDPARRGQSGRRGADAARAEEEQYS